MNGGFFAVYTFSPHFTTGRHRRPHFSLFLLLLEGIHLNLDPAKTNFLTPEEVQKTLIVKRSCYWCRMLQQITTNQ